MRLFVQVHPRRKHGFSEAIQQERRLTVEAAAAHRRHEMRQQARGHRCLEHYRRAARRELAPAEAADGALRRLVSDRRRCRQPVRGTADVVPIIALHAALVLGNDAHRQPVARRRLAGEKPVAVTVHFQAGVRRQRRALGVGDSAVGFARRGLADARQLNCLIHAGVPGVVKPEVGEFARQQRRIGQAGAIVRGGVFGDGAGGAHRVAHRRGRQVGGAGRTGALAEIHRNAQALVACVLHGLDLAQTHGHGQPLGDVDRGLGLRCAHAARLGQRLSDHVRQPPARAVVGKSIRCGGLGNCSRRCSRRLFLTPLYLLLP